MESMMYIVQTIRRRYRTNEEGGRGRPFRFLCHREEKEKLAYEFTLRCQNVYKVLFLNSMLMYVYRTRRRCSA